MKITTKADVWKAAIAMTVIAYSIVSIAILKLYPREEWLWELSVSGMLTISICMVATYNFGLKVLENHQLSLELQRLVSRDRLTDAATRDFFYERMQRDPDAYGVSLMVDIDHFKSINDTYGHLVGDDVIRHVSSILRSECRAQDIVCRFGGEEFVVFLHEADGDKGLLVAERMRMKVEAAPALSNEQKVSVTVSIGGSLKERMEDINVSIKQADEALYRAKNLGRNRTIVNWLPTPFEDTTRRAS
ncbi:MAG: GGDEF domain-containing protein [Litoreibacter sp.]|nr:GGDEF domain-containing protein [Litoreibacter sp.]